MKWGESGRSVVMAGSLYKYVNLFFLPDVMIARDSPSRADNLMVWNERFSLQVMLHNREGVIKDF